MENSILNETNHCLIRKSSQQTSENEHPEIKRSIQKGGQTRFHFERVLNFEYCLLLFSSMNLVLSVCYYDADYVGKSQIATLCLYFMFTTLVLEIVITIFRYFAQVCLEQSQRILDPEETLVTSGKVYYLFAEIFLLVLQPYPFINSLTVSTDDIYDGFSFDFKINYILVLLGFAKIFIVVRVILRRQIYMSPRSSRLCRMYGCESDYLYAIKCLFKDSPMSLIGLVFASSIVLFAVSLRIAERNLNVEYPKHNGGQQNPQDIEKFENSLWLTIITMTTVGYGDFFPRTLIGRLIDVLLVVWGTFIVSLMVVVLTNTLNMDQSEKRALIVLNRLEAKKQLKDSAAFLITHSCKKYLLRKRVSRGIRPPPSDEQQQKMDNLFYKYLTNFQSVHRTIRSMYEIDDVYEEMTRQFQFINDEISFLLSGQQQTIANLTNYLESQVEGEQDSDMENQEDNGNGNGN